MGWLHGGAPLLRGGGAVELVSDDVIWAGTPDRYEAGSPNVVGAVALGAACERPSEIGMQCVAAHERALAERLWAALDEVDGLETLTLWPPGSVDRIGRRDLQPGGLPPLPAGGGTQRGARHRRPPRMLLRIR